MSSAVRNEFAAFSALEGTLDFEWLDGTGQLLDDWSMPVPPDYLPTVYPAGSCVHVKFRMRMLTREGTAIRNEHVLDCWIIDFPARTVRDDRVLFYESYIPERGAVPHAAFDEESRTLFHSFRPPL